MEITGARLIKMMGKNFYWVYMLECVNGHLYTGYTDDLMRRYNEHLDGSGGCRYTRSFRPVRIAWCWKVYEGRGSAMKVEAFIKKQSRKAKILIINQPGKLRAIFGGENSLKLKIVSVNPEKMLNALKKKPGAKS